jgi:hypothetical protein
VVNGLEKEVTKLAENSWRPARDNKSALAKQLETSSDHEANQAAKTEKEMAKLPKQLETSHRATLLKKPSRRPRKGEADGKARQAAGDQPQDHADQEAKQAAKRRKRK